MNQIAIQQIASELTLAGTEKVRERIGNGRQMAFRRAETLLCPLLMSSPSQTLTPYKGVYVIEGDIISPQFLILTLTARPSDVGVRLPRRPVGR